MSIESRVSAVVDELAELTSLALCDAVRTLRISIGDLTDYLEPPAGRPYGRRRINTSGNPKIEVLVMNWASSFECLPHDHADSFGCFLVITGEAEENRFKLNGSTELILTGSAHHLAGDVVEAPVGLIHSMVNPSASPLVTLHFYAPPITTMRVFAPERCKGCVVANCGAWWPNSNQIVSEFPVT